MAQTFPHFLVVSGDETLKLMASQVGGERYRVQFCINPYSALKLSSASRLKAMLIDDTTLVGSERNTLLIRLRQWAPRAFLIYVAQQQSPEIERQARACGVHYYTAKPIERERLSKVLKAFLEFKGPRGLLP